MKLLTHTLSKQKHLSNNKSLHLLKCPFSFPCGNKSYFKSPFQSFCPFKVPTRNVHRISPRDLPPKTQLAFATQHLRTCPAEHSTTMIFKLLHLPDGTTHTPTSRPKFLTVCQNRVTWSKPHSALSRTECPHCTSSCSMFRSLLTVSPTAPHTLTVCQNLVARSHTLHSPEQKAHSAPSRSIQWTAAVLLQ